MDNDKVLRTYDEICNTALINLFGLSKNMKTINIELYDLNSYNSKFMLMTARNVQAITGKKIKIKCGFWDLVKFKWKNKKNKDLKHTKEMSVNSFIFLNDLKQAFEADNDVFEKIYKEFYEENEKCQQS